MARPVTTVFPHFHATAATALAVFGAVACSTAPAPSRMPRESAARSLPGVAVRQDAPDGGADAAKLAQQLANPVAALISVPLQLNHYRNIGPVDDGARTQLNVQPVVPFDLSEDWNLISRTILPIVAQDDVFPGAGDQFGTGDVLQSVFFSTAPAWICSRTSGSCESEAVSVSSSLPSSRSRRRTRLWMWRRVRTTSASVSSSIGWKAARASAGAQVKTPSGTMPWK